MKIFHKNMNFHNEFVNKMLCYFIEEDGTFTRSNIVKRHCDRFNTSGDYSFPISAQNWKVFLNDSANTDGTIFAHRGKVPSGNYAEDDHETELLMKQIQALIEESLGWFYPIQKATIYRNRCILFLDRINVYAKIFELALNQPDYGKLNKDGISSVALLLSPEDDEKGKPQSITAYRCALLRRVVRNLIGYLKFTPDEGYCQCVILITHQSAATFENAPPNQKQQVILCGVAKEPSSCNKNAVVSAEDYTRSVLSSVKPIFQLIWLMVVLIVGNVLSTLS